MFGRDGNIENYQLFISYFLLLIIYELFISFFLYDSFRTSQTIESPNTTTNRPNKAQGKNSLIFFKLSI